VVGLGLAALLDVATFLRDAKKDDQGNANPLADDLKYALLNGISQSPATLLVRIAGTRF